MSFGSNSTNPRVRRAYAHTLRTKALQTGSPEHKIEALEAANCAGQTLKGNGLAFNAFNAFKNQSDKTKSIDGFSVPINVRPVEMTDSSSCTSWTSSDFIRRYEALNTMLDISGVVITELSTSEDYEKAKDEINSNNAQLNLDEVSVRFAQSNGYSLVQCDRRVPGTLFVEDAVQVLARDTASSASSAA